MNKSVISPCKGTVRRYGKKMTPNTDVFLLTKSMFVILRSGTSPMNIRRFYIHIIPYPDKPLDFIIFPQSKGKDLNFFGNFDPINFPPVLFVEFSRKDLLSILNTTVSLISPVSVSLRQGTISSSQMPTPPAITPFFIFPPSAYMHKKAGL